MQLPAVRGGNDAVLFPVQKKQGEVFGESGEGLVGIESAADKQGAKQSEGLQEPGEMLHLFGRNSGVTAEGGVDDCRFDRDIAAQHRLQRHRGAETLSPHKKVLGIEFGSLLDGFQGRDSVTDQAASGGLPSEWP